MKDPNDFMLVESEGEQVKRLTAELAAARNDRLGADLLACDRIRSLEVELGAANSAVFRTSGELDIAVRRIRSLEVDLIKTKQERNDELRLRQTAEAYAARNALRVIEVEAELAEFKKHIPLKGGVPLRQYVLETALREISKDNFLYKSTQIAIKALNPPQTETACTCDSTLVTDTSNHQPHCPRYVAETAGVKP